MHVFVTTAFCCSYKNVHNMCNYNFMDQDCKEIWTIPYSLNIHSFRLYQKNDCQHMPCTH